MFTSLHFSFYVSFYNTFEKDEEMKVLTKITFTCTPSCRFLKTLRRPSEKLAMWAASVMLGAAVQPHVFETDVAVLSVNRDQNAGSDHCMRKNLLDSGSS